MLWLTNGDNMRVLVCGSRDWPEDGLPAAIICSTLLGLYYSHEVGVGTLYLDPFVVIQGGARGADSVAKNWAENDPLHPPLGKINPNFNVPYILLETYMADWKTYGKSAGFIRNKKMLEEGKPDLVLAFKSRDISKGTDMMIDLAKYKVPIFITYLDMLDKYKDL